jgi:hypothetical protein
MSNRFETISADRIDGSIRISPVNISALILFGGKHKMGSWNV